MEELKRVSAENKKLTEMLTVVCENYNTLRGHLVEQMNKNGEKEISSSRKRKSESSNNNMVVNGINGNSESSSSDEESYKKPKEETINKAAKTTRIQVKIGASESNLVSFSLLLMMNKEMEDGIFNLNLDFSFSLNL